MEYKPYTYLIGWSKLNRYYYGVEFKNSRVGCAHPNNLWTTYFTSSKTIQYMRSKYGEPDVIKVRKIFNNKHKAINWEREVLKRLKVLDSDKWINSNIGGAIVLSLETRALIAEKNRGIIKHSAEERARRSAETRARNLKRGKLSEETKRKISEAKTGKSMNFVDGRRGKSNPMYGRRKLPDGTWIRLTD